MSTDCCNTDDPIRDLNLIVERQRIVGKLDYSPVCYLYDEMHRHYYTNTVQQGFQRWDIGAYDWASSKSWQSICTDKFMLLESPEMGVCGKDPKTGKFIKDYYFDLALTCYLYDIQPGQIDDWFIEHQFQKEKPVELKHLVGMIYEYQRGDQDAFCDAYLHDSKKNYKNL